LGPVFIFCPPGHIFGGTECVVSRFHVLRARTHFRRYRGRRVPFSCFACPDSFSAIQRALGPVFMFCAPGLVFDGTKGFGSRFHVLFSQTHFRRCRMLRVPFSYFTRPDSFSAEQSASGLVFMFCAPGLIFGGIECVRSRFHVLRVRNVFGGTEGVEARFHVLCSRSIFRRCPVRRVPFSYFVRPDSF
jgi:hypothetical protein